MLPTLVFINNFFVLCLSTFLKIIYKFSGSQYEKKKIERRKSYSANITNGQLF
jgi:hypothetical protein